MPGVSWTFSGDDKNVQRALASFVRQQERLNQRMSEFVRKARDGEGAVSKAGEAHRRTSEKAQKGLDIQKALTTQAVQFAASYASIQAVSGSLLQFYQEQVQLQKEAADEAERIARAQSTAIKNFAGLPAGATERLTAFGKTIPLDQAIVTDALSVAATKSAANEELARRSVATAAEVSMADPQALPAAVAGLTELSRAIGTLETDKAMGMILELGTFANVQDPIKVSRNIGSVLTTGIERFARDGNEAARIEAARQMGSMWATVTQTAGDSMGELSATGAIRIAQEFDDMFTGMPEELANTKSRLAELNALALETPAEKRAIETASIELSKSTDDLAQLQRQYGGVADLPDNIKRQMRLAEIEVANRKDAVDKAKVDASLDAKQAAERAELLTAEKAMTEAIAKNAVLPLDQLAAVQASPFLQSVMEGKEFGEAKIQGAIMAMIRGETLQVQGNRLDPMRLLRRIYGEVGFDTEVFERVKAEQDATPELANTIQRNRFRAAEQRIITTPAAVAAERIASLVDKTLQATPPDIVSGMVDSALRRPATAAAIRSAGTTEIALQRGLHVLERRREVLSTQEGLFGRYPIPEERLSQNAVRAIEELNIAIGELRGELTGLRDQQVEVNVNLNQGNAAANAQAAQGQPQVAGGP